MFQRNEIFRLQLFTAAWREAHFKVWQTLIPWSLYAHLVGTAFGRMVHYRVKVFGCSFGAIKFRLAIIFFIHAAFYPNLVDAVALPVGKQADTISGGYNIFKMCL